LGYQHITAQKVKRRTRSFRKKEKHPKDKKKEHARLPAFRGYRTSAVNARRSSVFLQLQARWNEIEIDTRYDMQQRSRRDDLLTRMQDDDTPRALERPIVAHIDTYMPPVALDVDSDPPAAVDAADAAVLREIEARSPDSFRLCVPLSKCMMCMLPPSDLFPFEYPS
jgi:hypothetical protein